MATEPLVSICIPTYQRPEFFRQALESVLHQTYQNLDIFVTDDSADDRTEQLIQPYLADGRITYEHHPEYTSADNWERLRVYDNPEAEYVCWLMDDDLFLPDKIRSMVEAFREHPDVSLVTSYRPVMDGNGNLLPAERQPPRIIPEDMVLDGQSAGCLALVWVMNYSGEPSSTLMRKSFIENHRDEWFDIKPAYDFHDVPMWLNLLQKGNLYYFAKPLSYFRMHGNNEQMDHGKRAGSVICWAQLIEHAWETHQFLRSENDLAKSLRRLIGTYLHICQEDWFVDLPEEMRRDYEAVIGTAFLAISKLPEEETPT